VLVVHDTGFWSEEVRRPLVAVHRDLILDDVRNALIVDDVAEALGRGRNCLVLTRWVAHVGILVSLLAARGHRALVVRGGMSAAERRAASDLLAGAAAGDGVLVVGTAPLAGEGGAALDTLFLAGPVSFEGLLIQCVWRVIRAAPGKEVAEVHDYHDRAVPVLAASLRGRLSGYRMLGFSPTP
jgi:superfamily II DNA or RNA helicase